ncbi:MAG TPA: ion channel [Mycobacterium sp.]|nr:ion channel [Mycobacterium sp.]
MNPGTGGDRLHRWERSTEYPLAAMAAVFLCVYSFQVLVRPRPAISHTVNVVMLALYLVFVVDYLVRLALASDRWRWFFHHLLDLAIVALPFLFHLRALRLIVLVQILQRAAGDAVRGRVAVYAAGSAVLLVYVAALASLQTERLAPHANITTFGNALWWSITTITTVGYGDYYPVTTSGKVIAALLMIGGISLLGVITATITSWIVQRVAEEDSASQAVTIAHVEQLRQDIARLSEQLERVTAVESVPDR